MTNEEIKASRAICEAATPGPWLADLDVFDAREGIVACITSPNIDLLAKIETGLVAPGADDDSADEKPWTAAQSAKWDADHLKAREGQEMRDAAFIAHARTTLPRALAEVDRLRALLLEVDPSPLYSVSEGKATP